MSYKRKMTDNSDSHKKRQKLDVNCRVDDQDSIMRLDVFGDEQDFFLNLCDLSHLSFYCDDFTLSNEMNSGLGINDIVSFGVNNFPHTILETLMQSNKSDCEMASVTENSYNGDCEDIQLFNALSEIRDEMKDDTSSAYSISDDSEQGFVVYKRRPWMYSKTDTLKQYPMICSLSPTSIDEAEKLAIFFETELSDVTDIIENDFNDDSLEFELQELELYM